MANLIAAANDNFTGASTWGAVETGTGAEQTSVASSTATTTSYVYSPTFTGTAANVVDGIMLHVNLSNASGTFSVALSEDGGTTATREVTINASDLTSALATYHVFFKFGSSLTLDGGSDYCVGVKSSVNGAVTVARSGTAADWFRLLRLTTFATAAAADNLHVAGEWTGAATVTSRTVTMNSTAATDYGTIIVASQGTLSYATAAATNYVLRTSGIMSIWSGGTLSIGTTGTPIPRDSTAVLEFDCTTDGEFGLVVSFGATFNSQGLSRTSGKNVIACRLNTDEAIASTSLGVDTDTGWLDNDEIAVAATTQTGSQCEAGTLNGNAGASSLTVDGFAGAGGGLAFAHSGTSPTQAEVVLLTRNVKIRSVSTTAMAYVTITASATVDIDWTEFRYLGDNVSGKRGVEISTTTGSCNIQFSCIRDCEDMGCYITGSSANNITFSNNVMYNCGSVTSPAFQLATATSGTSIVVSGNYLIRCVAGSGFQFNDIGNTVTNNVAVGAAQAGFNLTESAATFGTFSGNISHSSATGITITGTLHRGTLSDCTVWRNSGAGVSCATFIGAFDTLVAFGNAGGGIDLTSPGSVINLTGCTMESDAAFSQSTGIEITTAGAGFNVVIADNCDFGQGVAHDSADLQLVGAAQMYLRNCNLSSQEGIGTLHEYGFIAHDNPSYRVNDLYLATEMVVSRIYVDKNIYHTVPPSTRIFSSTITDKAESAPFGHGMKATVANGEALAVSVWVRKSAESEGDADDYTGNEPRLVVRANPAIGIDADTVVDTASAALGTWEQLAGLTPAATDDGVMEFIVDCDGAVGWINVSDWAATSETDPLSLFGSDLVLWLDANEGVYNDAGTTLATNGQTVQQWNDQSGNGYNVSQATSGNRPALNTTGFNGLPGIEFTTSSDFMSTVTDAVSLGGSVVSGFAVLKITAGNSSTNPRIWSFNAAGATHDFDNVGSCTVHLADSLQFFAGSRNSVFWMSQVTFSHSTNYRVGGIWDGVNYTTYKDNVAGTPAASAPGSFGSTGTLSVATNPGEGTTAALGATIAELVIVKRALSSDERDALDAYFVAKWGL